VDEMFELLWQKYRTWSVTSVAFKQKNAAWRRNVLILTIGGTALATLGPFAPAPLSRILPMIGAAALALATYFGRELLDTKHEEQWTRARAAAEALKSEAFKYLVQAPPYDVPERAVRLKDRLAEINGVTKDQTPRDLSADERRKGMPQAPWTVDQYLTDRVGEQVTWYRTKAAEHSASTRTGRIIALSLGAAAVLLSTVTGATDNNQTVWAAILGVVTTAAGSIGAYYQAGHFEAIALKYRAAADALEALAAAFRTGQDKANLVSNAEAIMQAENAAWLTQLTTTPAS